jgi:hypothetical protein
MSTGVPLKMGDAGRYTVMVRDGVTLVEGVIPLDHFTALVALAGEGGVISNYLAQLAQVQWAWGQPDDIDRLARQLKEEILLARPNITPLERWLAVGIRGKSSNAIVANLRGVSVDDPTAHPHDPTDLWRCVMLLEEVTELREDFGLMAKASTEWERLVNAWGDLEQLLREEAGDCWGDGQGWQSPKTYEALKLVLAGSKRIASDLEAVNG